MHLDGLWSLRGIMATFNQGLAPWVKQKSDFIRGATRAHHWDIPSVDVPQALPMESQWVIDGKFPLDKWCKTMA